MKILFINAIIPYKEVQNRWPNLGFGYLVASLRQHFGKTAIQFNIIDNNVERELDSFRPNLVGITSVSQNYNYAKAYAHMAKQRGIPVIIGGVHISALPQTKTQDMDVAVLGEGEETIVELVEALMDGRSLINIKGTAFRDDANVFHQTKPRDLIEPLDEIPFPARDLFKIRAQSNIFSSRGCPYRCVFCSSSRYWQKVRFFSAEYVVEEIREMVGRYGVKRINFYDDLMIADLPRLHRIVGLISRDPKLRGIKFWINARANLITSDVARLLNAMGVVSVGLGLESGNAKTLKFLKGGSVTVNDNYGAIRILHHYGIKATGSFIIGSPYETRAEILDTYNFIKESGIDFADTFLLTPFPGTPIWDYAMTNGIVSEDIDWGRLNVYPEDPVLVSQVVGRAEMLELYRKFKRQRLRIAARKAWFHPFFREMVRAGAVKLWNKCRGILWN